MFDLHQIVVTKNDAFFGNNQGLLMLNVSKIMNNKASPLAYIVDSCDVWHNRLAQVNFLYY